MQTNTPSHVRYMVGCVKVEWVHQQMMSGLHGSKQFMNLGCEDVMGSGVVSLVGDPKTMLRVSQFR